MEATGEPRVALVTGAAGGIGRAIVHELAGAGFVVAVNDRSAELTAEVVETLRSDGGAAHGFPADLSDQDLARGLAEVVVSRLGRLDAVVANAGAMGGRSLVADGDTEDLVRQLEMNAVMPALICSGAAAALRESRGVVVLISSMEVGRHQPRSSSYTAAKAAAEAIAFTMANEERRHGVRVNVVAPGLVDTPTSRAVARRAFGREDLVELGKKLGFRAVCRPEDVASVVRTLIDETHMTGQRITVEGA
jgi:NAD(P)-dependent dehydrogenase (short-subunit alcohol dehydrogenase family)